MNPNTFVDGGTVYLGAKVDMQSSLKLGWTPSGTIDLNTSIEINQNATNGNGVKVQTWNSSVKAFSVFNTGNGINKNTFVVYGDGRTQIGTGKPKVGGVAANAMLSVDGLILAKEIRVAVSTTTHWADYVFDTNYKLTPLKEVKKFIDQNKHLQHIPNNKTVEEQGVNLVEMDALLLQKTEENTLYLINHDERIEQLEKENAELKALLKIVIDTYGKK